MGNMINPLINKKNRYLINIIIFFLAVFLFSGFIHTKGIAVSVEADGIRISYPSEEALMIKNADIKSIEETDHMDLGTFLKGVDTRTNQYGIGENEEFGSYYLAVKHGISHYIVIKTAADVYVFNFESNDATTNFYTVYRERLQEAGIPLTLN